MSLTYCTVLLAVLCCFACRPNPETPPSGLRIYHGIRVNIVTGVMDLAGVPAADGWFVLAKEPRMAQVDVRDPSQSQSDFIWGSQDKVIDWTAYKTLASFPKGSVTLVQRYQPAYPGGNRSPAFALQPGERGSILEKLPGGLVTEGMFLFYAYQSGDWLSAWYGPSGNLRQISSGTAYNTGFWHRDGRSTNPYKAYSIPEDLTGPAVAPPLNPHILGGLEWVESFKYKSSPMVAGYLIRQFGQGTIFQVTEVNPSGAVVFTRYLQFSPRPYDAEVLRDQNSP